MKATNQNIQGTSIIQSWVRQTAPDIVVLSPDVIDDFVTWCYERYDLISFSQSDPEWKMRQFEKFCREELAKSNNQLKMNFE